MDLTPLGRQLLDELGPAYAQVQTAIARATATGHGASGELHLGYMSAAVARHVLTLVDTFHARTPGCRVTIRETALADLCGPLRRGEIDLSILPLPVAEPDLTVGPVLLSEAALLAVPTDHRLAQRTHVTPADLTEQTFLFAQDLPTTGSSTTSPSLGPRPGSPCCPASKKCWPTSHPATASPRRRCLTICS